METGIFRCFRCFLRIWRTRAKYKADKMEDKVDTYPTLMLMLKNEEEKLFQKYQVFLPTR